MGHNPLQLQSDSLFPFLQKEIKEAFDGVKTRGQLF